MPGILDDVKSGLSDIESYEKKAQGYSKDLRGLIADKSDGRRDDTKQRDPYVHLRFAVQIDQVDIALFSECSALTIENEVFEYQEGGLNTYVHKLPTRTKYGNVTLKRGVDDSQQLHTWFMQIAASRIKRQNVSIILYDATGKEVRRWDLQNAYPCKWTGPDLRADAGAVAVETVELAHEGLIPRGNQTSASGSGLLSEIESGFNKARGYAQEALDGFDKVTNFANEGVEMAQKGLDAGKGAFDEVKGLF